VVRRHQRFELLQVTLCDTPIGNATIDAWEDDRGTRQWSARVLMKTGHGSIDGPLTGTTRDGRVLAGVVHVGGDEQGPQGARTVLVELHGQGPLSEQDPSDPAG
jgi:hypothetical protein